MQRHDYLWLVFLTVLSVAGVVLVALIASKPEAPCKHRELRTTFLPMMVGKVMILQPHTGNVCVER